MITSNGHLKSPLILKGMGIFSDESPNYKFGRNAAVSNSEEDVWSLGTAYQWPTAAETVRVASGGNAADSAAGAGARKILVYGLNADWEEIFEEITLAGASASAATAQSFLRVYRAFVSEPGVYRGTNTDDIVIENTVSGDTLAVIEAGDGQTQMAHFTVPKGKLAIVTSIALSSDGTSSTGVRMKMWHCTNNEVITPPYASTRVLFELSEVLGTVNLEAAGALVLQERDDIWFTAERTSRAGTTSCSVVFDLKMVDRQR